MFDKFKSAFPRDESLIFREDVVLLSDAISRQFGIVAPPEVVELWTVAGCGYFGDRTIFVFGGDRTCEVRDSIVAWNSKDFWRNIYPSPSEGGPLFFAETCFGHQIGFRYENGKAKYVLFSVDVFDAFLLAESASEFFDDVLGERYSIIDPSLLEGVRQKLGLQPPGWHYCARRRDSRPLERRRFAAAGGVKPGQW